MELQQVSSILICFVWLFCWWWCFCLFVFFFPLFSLPDTVNTGKMFVLTKAESPLQESINLRRCCFYSLTETSGAPVSQSLRQWHSLLFGRCLSGNRGVFPSLRFGRTRAITSPVQQGMNISLFPEQFSLRAVIN